MTHRGLPVASTKSSGTLRAFARATMRNPVAGGGSAFAAMI